MKKILFVTSLYLFPPFWGGGQRTYNLLKSLGNNFEVYFLCPMKDQLGASKQLEKKYRKELKKLGIKIFTYHSLININHLLVKYINPEIIVKGLELILTKKIDLIICDYPWSGINVLILHFLTGVPFIFHEHNIEYLIKDEIRAKYGKLMKILEKILCKKAKIIITVSQKDKNILSKVFKIPKKKIWVVENGFDETRFYPNNKNVEKIRRKYKIGKNPLIIFFGKLDYPPNKEAVYKIYWEILPRVLKILPQAKFLIVGKKYPFEFKPRKELIFTGLVKNIEDYVNAADIVIVPLRVGSGTRIKILESIACGKKIVSTSKGAEGLINKLTKPFLFIADDWDRFCELIVEKLSNYSPPKPSSSFFKKYSWKQIGEKLVQKLKKI